MFMFYNPKKERKKKHAYHILEGGIEFDFPRA